MESNISENVTPKLVGMIVAIIVLACVMIPICNSLVSDGNGGGSGSGETTVSNEQYVINKMAYDTNPTFEITPTENKTQMPVLYADSTTAILRLGNRDTVLHINGEGISDNLGRVNVTTITKVTSDGQTVTVDYTDRNSTAQQYEFEIASPCYYADANGEYGVYINPSAISQLPPNITVSSTYDSLYVPNDYTPHIIYSVNMSLMMGYDKGHIWGINADIKYQPTEYYDISDNKITDAGWILPYRNTEKVEEECPSMYMILPNEVTMSPGSGEDSDLIYLNTIGDEYGISDLSYKTYQLYNSSTTPTLSEPIHYTLETLKEWEQTLGQYNFPADSSIDLLEITHKDNGNIYNDLTLTYHVAGEHIRETGIGITIIFTSPSMGYNDTRLKYFDAFEFTLTTDYQFSATATSTNYQQVQSTYTKTSTSTDVKTLSESEKGYVISTDYANYLEKFTVGSEIQMYVESGFGEGIEEVIGFTVSEDMISGNTMIVPISGYPAKVVIQIQSTDTKGVWQFAPSVKEYNDETERYNGYTLQDENGNPVSDYYYITMDWEYISSYGNAPSDSGSGSGGVSGISATIIKLLPVFVAIGLILAMVSMFYDPRELIGGQQ